MSNRTKIILALTLVSLLVIAVFASGKKTDASAVLPAEPYFNLPSRQAGDFDLDGRLTPEDYAAIRGAVSGLQHPATWEQWRMWILADTNQDKRLDPDDFYEIRELCGVYAEPPKAANRPVLPPGFELPNMLLIGE